MLSIFFFSLAFYIFLQLRMALLRFPSLLVELMDTCGISLDDSIKKHSYFEPTSYLKQSAALNQLISLYVGRSNPLWKAPEVINWLVEISRELLDNFDDYQSDIEKEKEL